MRAAVYHGPGDVRTEEIPDPAVDRTGIVLRVTACGVCGSDVHVWQRGSLVRPGQVLGHEFGGVVTDVGSEVEGVDIGDRVVALPYAPCRSCPSCVAGRVDLCEVAFRRSIANGLPGGFAEQLHVPSAVVGRTVHHLPPDVPDDAAALVEPLAVGLHAVAAATPPAGATAVVLGLGSIGLAVVHALRARGVDHVVAIDRAPLRRAAAADAGATVVDDVTDLEDAVRALTGPGPYGSPAAATSVYECSGAASLLEAGVRVLGMAGQLVLVALYGEPPPLPANLVVRKGLAVTGSFGYGEAEFPAAIRLLREGSVDADRWITHRYGLEDVDRALATQADTSASLKVVVQPGTNDA